MTQQKLTPVQQRMIQEFSELGQQLEEVADTSYHINRSEFSIKLLPILATIGDNFNIDAWEGVIGNAYRSVIVHDDQTMEVIYNIPPLLRQLESSGELGERLNDHRNEMHNLQVDSPMQHAEVVYGAMIATRGKDEPEALSAKAMAEVLIRIFSDYKLALPEHLHHNAGEQQNQAAGEPLLPVENNDYERDFELP